MYFFFASQIASFGLRRLCYCVMHLSYLLLSLKTRRETYTRTTNPGGLENLDLLTFGEVRGVVSSKMQCALLFRRSKSRKCGNSAEKSLTGFSFVFADVRGGREPAPICDQAGRWWGVYSYRWPRSTRTRYADGVGNCSSRLFCARTCFQVRDRVGVNFWTRLEPSK